MISKIQRKLDDQEREAVVYSAVPIIPTCRPIGYFLTGCKVVCLINGKFQKGEIIENWGHAVTIRYEEKVFKDGAYLNGYGGSSGIYFIGLLHWCEYKFLLKNPEFGERFFVDSWMSKRWQYERYPQYTTIKKYRRPTLPRQTYWNMDFCYPIKREFTKKSPQIEEWQRVANEFLVALKQNSSQK